MYFVRCAVTLARLLLGVLVLGCIVVAIFLGLAVLSDGRPMSMPANDHEMQEIEAKSAAKYRGTKALPAPRKK